MALGAAGYQLLTCLANHFAVTRSADIQCGKECGDCKISVGELSYVAFISWLKRFKFWIDGPGEEFVCDLGHWSIYWTSGLFTWIFCYTCSQLVFLLGCQAWAVEWARAIKWVSWGIFEGVISEVERIRKVLNFRVLAVIQFLKCSKLLQNSQVFKISRLKKHCSAKIWRDRGIFDNFMTVFLKWTKFLDSSNLG